MGRGSRLEQMQWTCSFLLPFSCPESLAMQGFFIFPSCGKIRAENAKTVNSGNRKNRKSESEPLCPLLSGLNAFCRKAFLE